MLVSNTDDHLRNHGFLLEAEGWRLAPAFDVNPNPHGAGLRLNVSEESNEQDLSLALDVAKHFRVSGRRASELVGGHFNCGVIRVFPFRFQVDEQAGVNQTLALFQCCSPLFKELGSRQKEVPSGSIASPSYRAKCLHAFS